jgi:flagellar assembly protein FliH
MLGANPRAALAVLPMEPFQYPEDPGRTDIRSDQNAELFREIRCELDRLENESERPVMVPSAATEAAPAEDAAGLDRQRAEQLALSIVLARQDGLASGREEAACALEAERSRFQLQLSSLLERMAEERRRWLEELSRESARLALSIAARILRREAETDPLLVLGAVREALYPLAHAAFVKIRVPEADKELWEEALRLIPGLDKKPQVLGAPEMMTGDCGIDTEFGWADLSVRSQLNEIHRSFFSAGELSDTRGRQAPVSESPLSPERTEAAGVEQEA